MTTTLMFAFGLLGLAYFVGAHLALVRENEARLSEIRRRLRQIELARKTGALS